MKIPLLFALFFITLSASAQITTPVMKAFFGVDADLKARSFNGSLQAGDDWYVQNGTSGTALNGTYVIDTTGAASIIAGYATDVSPFPKRTASFYRTMSKPAFSVVNNRLWLDALFVRDYHGTDTSVFVLASKNGQSPADWTSDIQSIPDKNDILDMLMHIRRNGPTSTDSLWMFGGVSIENTQGNRYFDFEMYQTDIYYDRPSRKWFGYGPDAGHTSWKFDAAGNVTQPGDIIFSAGFQSGASVSYIEARIWIDQASLNVTPAQFKWSGSFDGAGNGSQYGYAGILPKTAGDFYIMTQSGNNEWAGPFSLVIGNNTLQPNYTGKQFMEFAVNLSKLGLDPVTTFGGDVCGTPFNRLVVKSRSSESFTSSLKDFVAPTDLFLAPRVAAIADVPLYCGNANNVSSLQVTNPSASSVYTWSTPNGRIISDPASSSVTVDSAGMYVVRQQLMAGCSTYALDTVYVTYDPTCTVLDINKIDFNVALKDNASSVNWTSHLNHTINYYEVQKSIDGKYFESISRIDNSNKELPVKAYAFQDGNSNNSDIIYYRLKIATGSGIFYTRIISVRPTNQRKLFIHPNPVVNTAKVIISSEQVDKAVVTIYNISGEKLYVGNYNLASGQNVISIDKPKSWKAGVYLMQINSAVKNEWQRFVVGK